MNEYSIPDLSVENLDRGYENQWQLMEDLSAVLDYRLYLYYKYHQWLGPGNDMKNMLGLVVGREEFEYKLSKAAQQGLYKSINEEERSQLETSEQAVARRLSQTQSPIPLVQLLERLQLSEFEEHCVIFAYAVSLDSKYERLLAYLQDDITKKDPSTALAVQLFLPEAGHPEAYMAGFDQDSSFTALFDRAARQAGSLILNHLVTELLSGGKLHLPPGMTIFDPAEEEPENALVIGQAMAKQLRELMDSDLQGVITISGATGSGKRFQIKQLMKQRAERCLFVEVSAFPAPEEAIAQGVLGANLLGAYLCYYGLETGGEDGQDGEVDPHLIEELLAAPGYRSKGFLLSQKPLRSHTGRPLIDLVIDPIDSAQRLTLFTYFLEELPLAQDVSLRELASKFRFEPLQIRRASQQAAAMAKATGQKTLDNALIHRCCYQQVVHSLDKLATRVKPRYSWEDLVLPPEQKAIMQHACSHVRYQHRVYNEWGFQSKVSYGRGLSLLFAGSPGTGKTMCAQIMANQLNMELYKINISQIISKYIGETEKNLHALFREARNSNCMLFFDECDALFGKRSEVKDSHDRNANIEVAYLLQQIEEHDGVCVLASNLIQNIDAAFMRRITYVVHFPFPTASARRQIYLQMLPANAPVEENIDWDFLAEKFNLSGGYIKNIVLSAAFMAAAEDTPISMRHLLVSAVNEMKKNDIVVVREDLREYADLLFAAP